MITIKKISKAQLPKLVEASYLGDDELIEKYHHLSPIGLPTKEMAIMATLQRIHEASQEVDLSYYKVIFEKKPIGYFVTFDNCLYSFCIAKRYRNREVLQRWFSNVKKVLGTPFQCVLYTHNTRAIKHLVKQGMEVKNIDEKNNLTTLIYY